MRIPITLEDLNNAGRYTSVNRCLLATALKRIYGNKAEMDVVNFVIGKRVYNISNASMEKIYRAYGDTPTHCSTGAKIVVKEPFTVYATLDKSAE